METLTFNLNSLDSYLERKSVSVKRVPEILSDDIKSKFTYVKDWLDIECLIHRNDSYFYIDEELIDNLNLEKVEDSKPIDLTVPGQTESNQVFFYKLKIYNSTIASFEEIHSLPFINLNKLLRVSMLIPTK